MRARNSTRAGRGPVSAVLAKGLTLAYRLPLSLMGQQCLGLLSLRSCQVVAGSVRPHRYDGRQGLSNIRGVEEYGTRALRLSQIASTVSGKIRSDKEKLASENSCSLYYRYSMQVLKTWRVKAQLPNRRCTQTPKGWLKQIPPSERFRTLIR